MGPNAPGSQNRDRGSLRCGGSRDYAFTPLACDHEINRVISMIRPENIPSRRVAEKNGLTLARTIHWRGYDHCVYTIDRPKQ